MIADHGDPSPRRSTIDWIVSARWFSFSYVDQSASVVSNLVATYSVRNFSQEDKPALLNMVLLRITHILILGVEEKRRWCDRIRRLTKNIAAIYGASVFCLAVSGCSVYWCIVGHVFYAQISFVDASNEHCLAIGYPGTLSTSDMAR